MTCDDMMVHERERQVAEHEVSYLCLCSHPLASHDAKGECAWNGLVCGCLGFEAENGGQTNG